MLSQCPRSHSPLLPANSPCVDFDPSSLLPSSLFFDGPLYYANIWSSSCLLGARIVSRRWMVWVQVKFSFYSCQLLTMQTAGWPAVPRTTRRVHRFRWFPNILSLNDRLFQVLLFILRLFVPLFGWCVQRAHRGSAGTPTLWCNRRSLIRRSIRWSLIRWSLIRRSIHQSIRRSIRRPIRRPASMHQFLTVLPFH